MAKDGMSVTFAKRISRPVTPAQKGFATGLSNVVKKFVDTKHPMPKRRRR